MQKGFSHVVFYILFEMHDYGAAFTIAMAKLQFSESPAVERHKFIQMGDA
jgi:hypothetical protein